VQGVVAQRVSRWRSVASEKSFAGDRDRDRDRKRDSSVHSRGMNHSGWMYGKASSGFVDDYNGELEMKDLNADP